jgi:hypothetical protein
MSAPLKQLRASLECFFDAASLPQYRKYIVSMLFAARNRGVWQKGDPATLLDIQEQLLRLIRSIHRFGEKKVRRRPKQVLDPRAIEPKLLAAMGFFSGTPLAVAWTSFPRFLSRREWLDPFSVFEGFFLNRSLAEWEQDLAELLKYALSSASGEEMNCGVDFLDTYLQLQKLIEAAHQVFYSVPSKSRDLRHNERY